jgi:hypothetical protein
MPHLNAEALTSDPLGLAFLRDALDEPLIARAATVSVLPAALQRFPASDELGCGLRGEAELGWSDISAQDEVLA